MSGAFCGAYDILPDALYDIGEFNDAIVLFTRTDGKIIASRAPAAVFAPGKKLVTYLPGASRMFDAGGFSVSMSDTFGEILCGFRRLPTDRLPARSVRLGVGDDIYLRTVSDIPGLVFSALPAMIPDSDLPEPGDPFFDDDAEPCEMLPQLPTSLDRIDEILRKAYRIGEGAPGSAFFSDVAELVSEIAATVGAGVTFTDSCGLSAFGTVPGFDSSGLFVMSMVSAMLFRRVGVRRGFDMTVGMRHDGTPLPYFVLSALVLEKYASRQLPELAAMGGIAAGRGMTFECCRRQTEHGVRLYVFFAARMRDVGALGLKAFVPFDDEGGELPMFAAGNASDAGQYVY